MQSAIIGTARLLAELRRSKLVPLVVHALCNVPKFLIAEAGDFAGARDMQAEPELTEWDRYATAEYASLSMDDDDEDEIVVDDDELLEGTDSDMSNVRYWNLHASQMRTAGAAVSKEAPF